MAAIGAFGASIPEFVRVSLEDPSTVIPALLPGAKLIAGVVGVLPFNVSCDEPERNSRPPVSLLHARRSFVSVPHAKTKDTFAPVILDEIVALSDPANQ